MPDRPRLTLNDIDTAPREALPALALELAALQSRLAARMLAEAPAAGIAEEHALLNPKDMAARLGVAESWLREAARSGRVPCVRVGRYVRFDPAAVRRAVNGRATPP
jgi:excisionase family DNA binding protein